MDQDQFNDFEEASPTQPPKPSEYEGPPLNDHPQPTPANQSTQNYESDMNFDGGYSVVTEGPSQQTYGLESMGWEGSVWPSLSKMESDRLAVVEPMQVDFSKRKSQREENNESHNYNKDLLFGGSPPRQQSNFSNSATIHTTLFEDFNTGMDLISYNDHQTSEMPSPSQKIKFKPEEKGEDTVKFGNEFKQSNTNLQKQEQIRKDSDDFNEFEQPNQEKRTEFEEMAEQSHTEQRKPSEEFVFQQPETRKESDEFVYQEAQPEERKESEQFEYQEAEPEVRKESQQFEYQSAEQEVNKELQQNVFQQAVHSTETEQYIIQNNQNPADANTTLTIPEQNYQYNQVQTILTEKQADFQAVQEVQIALTLNGEQNIQKQQQPTTHQVQAIQAEDDDQFGQFEETVPANPTIEEPPTVQSEPVAEESNTVKVDPGKVPYGCDLNQKQRELQQFVSSLPNYSFLLKMAFTEL